MEERSDAVRFGIAFAFGLLVPAGLAALPAGGVPDALAPLLSLGWFVAIGIGAAALGSVLGLPTDAVVGGGVLGSLVGFRAFAALVGWSFVMFAVAPLAILALVAGAWLSYERARRRGDATEPTYGSWRGVFAAIAFCLLAVSLLVLVA
ncbi:hypothetical protein [Natronococcus occultus]|uniref:Uncharacterized protein n=1 Tax=Natronococcus occultus SP4 TaxID=694430 RepID=L0K263_9EURY|nr:hypothetical protein [Natronococcus occultus]AGB38439.1 hypothetical protein Natoc_2677 [Natronococcus occultus SP4]